MKTPEGFPRRWMIDACAFRCFICIRRLRFPFLLLLVLCTLIPSLQLDSTIPLKINVFTENSWRCKALWLCIDDPPPIALKIGESLMVSWPEEFTSLIDWSALVQINIDDCCLEYVFFVCVMNCCIKDIQSITETREFTLIIIFLAVYTIGVGQYMNSTARYLIFIHWFFLYLY